MGKQIPSDRLFEGLEGADLPADVRAALDQLANENALLRASQAEMRERVGELEDQADSDAVTSLPNRRRFLREIERVVSSATRHNTPAALLHIDLDGLTVINTRYGRIAGDAALIHVGRLLSRLIRASDVLARIGDDEFGLILDHLDHNSAIETADRLALCIIDSPLEIGGTEVRVAASIGIATIMAGDSVEDVLDRAARNMCRAKSED